MCSSSFCKIMQFLRILWRLNRVIHWIVTTISKQNTPRAFHSSSESVRMDWASWMIGYSSTSVLVQFDIIIFYVTCCLCEGSIEGWSQMQRGWWPRKIGDGSWAKHMSCTNVFTNTFRDILIYDDGFCAKYVLLHKCIHTQKVRAISNKLT